LSGEAHTLKGSSATFGAVRLAAVCEALEQAGRDGNSQQAHALIEELEEAAIATQAALEQHLSGFVPTWSRTANRVADLSAGKESAVG
jgi:HPt (histidine-containing phosphotransfer) domain-containing protein